VWLEYMEFAHQGGFLGTVIYEVRLHGGSTEFLIFIIDRESIAAARGTPGASEVCNATCRLSMTIDVWRSVFSGAASSLDLIPWILAPEISVHPRQWIALKTFATSFEYSKSCWNRFYVGVSKARRYRPIVNQAGASASDNTSQGRTQSLEQGHASAPQDELSWYESHQLSRRAGSMACGVCPLVAYRYGSTKPRKKGPDEQKDKVPKCQYSGQPQDKQRNVAQPGIWNFLSESECLDRWGRHGDGNNSSNSSGVRCRCNTRSAAASVLATNTEQGACCVPRAPGHHCRVYTLPPCT
jgi:hypothetical protein